MSSSIHVPTGTIHRPNDNAVAIPSTDLEKRLEGLTPEDLRTAMEMARQAAPLLSKLVDENTVITLYQEEKITDWMHDADRIYKYLWAIDTPDVQKAFELHRSLTAKRERRGEFFKQIVTKCKTLIGRRKLAEDRRLADERREKERLAREEAERQRQAEMQALIDAAAAADKAGNTAEATAIMDQAFEVEQAPAIPVVVPEVVAPKVKGSSQSVKLVGTVKDSVSYLCYLLGVPVPDLTDIDRANIRIAMIREVVEFKQSGVDAQLKRGLPLDKHGVSVAETTIVRNLGRK